MDEKKYNVYNSTLKRKSTLKSKTPLSSKSSLTRSTLTSKTSLQSKARLSQSSGLKSNTSLKRTELKKGPIKSDRSKATSISQSVKEKVWERDKGLCVYCGTAHMTSPNAHYIRRSAGGLGIEQNIVTLCLQCHHEFDNGKDGHLYKEKVKSVLNGFYPGFDEKDLYYKK